MPVHDWTRVHPAIFHDFRFGWVVVLRRMLNRGRLPSGYYPLLANVAEGVGPDVADLTRPGGGLEIADRLLTGEVEISDETKWYARKANSVTIRLAKTHQVVAVLSIVSPGNKSTAEELDAFVRRAKELLSAGIHLTVVDLFPAGPHDPAGIHPLIWGGPALDNVDPARQLVCASYVGGPDGEAFIDVVAVGDPLPDTSIFLTPNHYVQIPLDESYRTAFEDVPEVWREVIDPGT